MDLGYKIIVIGLSLHRRGGVASVLSTFAQAGFFDNEQVIYHSSCGDGSKLQKFFSILRQWVAYIFRLLNDRPDLAHIHFSSGSSFWRKVPYILLSKTFGLGLLLNVHPTHFHDYFRKASPVVAWVIRHVLNCADCIGFANQNLISAFKPLFPHKQLVYLPNPVSLEKYYPDDSSARKNDQALYLGAILKIKGVYDILRAIPLVRKGGTNVHFIFCGDYETAKLRQQAIQLGLDSKVDIRDWISYEEKLRLLQQSTMLLLPSHSEGFPIVVLEAMACGLPVIATPVGGLQGVLQNEVNALIVEQGNFSMLAEKIELMAKDSTLREKLAANGFELAKKHDVRLVMSELKKLYNELIILSEC